MTEGPTEPRKGEGMKLQLLVPHYKEGPAEMLPLMESIAAQQAIDFADIGVIIVSDGSTATSLPESEWKSRFPYGIRFLHVPHGGVSAARNAALREASADYVMFCDADDMFCSAVGIYTILQILDAEQLDIVITRFVEETRRGGSPFIVQHDNDLVFVHGKVYRRQYLSSKDIWFCPALTVHEDSYFNALAASNTESIKFFPTVIYLWKWRDNSICRHDPDYLIKTYTNLIDSNDALSDEMARRGMQGKADELVAVMLFDAYYQLNKPDWTAKTNADYRAKVIRRLTDYYDKHRAQWEAIDTALKMQISEGCRRRAVREGAGMEEVTFTDWIKTIGG